MYDLSQIPVCLRLMAALEGLNALLEIGLILFHAILSHDATASGGSMDRNNRSVMFNLLVDLHTNL